LLVVGLGAAIGAGFDIRRRWTNRPIRQEQSEGACACPAGSFRLEERATYIHGFTRLFRIPNVPKGSYTIRVRLEGFENVNYPVGVPATPYVFIFLNGRSARGPAALGGNRVVDIRQLTANIPKRALKEYEKAVQELKEGNTQRGVERLQKSIKLAPDFYNAHLGLGQEYRKTGRLDAPKRNLLAAC